MLKKMTAWKRRVLEENDCKPHYYSYGYDAVCRGRKVLLLRLWPNRRVYITPAQLSEAYIVQPEVWLYNDVGLVARVPWKIFYNAVEGELPIEMEGRPVRVRVKLGGGRRGRVIKIQVDDETFAKWNELLRTTGLPPNELFRRLVERTI